MLFYYVVHPSKLHEAWNISDDNYLKPYFALLETFFFTPIIKVCSEYTRQRSYNQYIHHFTPRIYYYSAL